MCISLRRDDWRCAHTEPFLIFKHRNKNLPNLYIFQTNPLGKLWEHPGVVLEWPKLHDCCNKYWNKYWTNIETKNSGFSEQLPMSFNSNMGWFWFGNDSFWMKHLNPTSMTFPMEFLPGKGYWFMPEQTGGFLPFKIQVQFHALGYLRRRINLTTFTYCSSCPKFQRTAGILGIM